MKPFNLKAARKRLGLDRLQFARLIGYTGTDANDVVRVRRYENSVQPPLYIARMVDMLERWQAMFGKLPDFPDWPGYDYSHEPDSRHKQERIDGVG